MICKMVSVRILDKRIQALKRAVDDGVNYEGTESELTLLTRSMDALNIISKRLAPVKESMVNERAAKQEYAGQKILKDNGLNDMSTSDAITEYVKLKQKFEQMQQQNQTPTNGFDNNY